MKFTKLFLAIAVLTVAFASCKKSSDNLTNVIPADAMYVMHADIKSLAAKSDYDIFQNVTVSRAVNMGKALFSKKEAIDMLDALTKDINSFGINIKDDIYMYTDYEYYGVVAGVKDAEKIKNAFINFSLAGEDDIALENGIYSFSPDESAAIVWDADKILIIAKYSPYRYYRDKEEDEVDLVALAKKQLKQDAKESINSNDSFAKFIDNKKDMSVFSVFSTKYFAMLEYVMGSGFMKDVEEGLEQYKGVSTAMYVSFEKGEIKSEAKVYYPNSDVQKKYEQIMEQTSGKIEGNQLKYISAAPIFAISVSLNGTGLYNYLESINVTSKIEEDDDEGLFKTVLNEINGDITFALTNVEKVTKSYDWGGDRTYEYETTEPLYTLMVACKDGNKVLELAKGNVLDEDEVNEIGENAYSTDNNGSLMYFGNKDNMLYLTNIEEVSNNIRTKTETKDNYASAAKGNALFIGGNIKTLKPIIDEEVDDETVSGIANNLVNMFDGYSVTSPFDANGVTHAKIEMTDKSKNSFAVICQFLDSVLEIANDQIGF